jgi:hypothetical protein
MHDKPNRIFWLLTVILPVFFWSSRLTAVNYMLDLTNMQPGLLESLEVSFKNYKCETVYHFQHPNPKKSKLKTKIMQYGQGNLLLKFADLNKKPIKDLIITATYDVLSYEPDWINDGQGLVLDLARTATSTTTTAVTDSYGAITIPFVVSMENTYSSSTIHLSYINPEQNGTEITSLQGYSNITVTCDNGRFDVLEKVELPLIIAYIKKTDPVTPAEPIKPALAEPEPATEPAVELPLPAEQPAQEPVQPVKKQQKKQDKKSVQQQKSVNPVKPAKKEIKQSNKIPQDRLTQKTIINKKKVPIFNGYVLVTLTRDWIKSGKEISTEYGPDWYVKFSVKTTYYGKNKIFMPKVSINVPWPDETYELGSLNEKVYVFDSQSGKFAKICGGPMVNLNKSDSTFPWEGPYELIIKYTTGEPQKFNSNGVPYAWATEPYSDTITLPFYIN